MKFGKTLASLVLGGIVALGIAGNSKADVIDKFEDGNINTANWITHGYKGGIGGVGAGNWNYSFSENIATDGYLEARVWGPTSGNTYGAEASVRTQQNFNDSKEWLVNFTWDANVKYMPHVNQFAIQLTDGNNLDNTNWFWIMNQMPEGTLNLYQTATDREPTSIPQPDSPLPPFSKSSWSILIQNGSASLYQTANAQGNPLRQVSLDSNKEWYIRFMLNDATSAGFAQGDNSFRLYDYSAIQVPEPATFGLLALGGLGVLSKRRKSA